MAETIRDEANRELSDVLAETGTRQAEWVIGGRAIFSALKMVPSGNVTRLPKDVPTLSVKNLYHGSQAHMLICYRPNIDAWLKKHKPAPLPLPTPEQREENRLALLERAVQENTDTLKMLTHNVNLLVEDVRKIL
jgi:hypothetical protein